VKKATAEIDDLKKTGASAPAKRVRRSAEETRQDILSMADVLFRERGFSNVAIADIATALAMSPANVFKHFRSKIDLVDEIAQRMVNNMACHLTVLNRSHPPRERIHHLTVHLMQKHYEDFRQNPYIFELLQLTAERDLQCGQHYRSVIADILQAIITDAKDDGLYFSADPARDAQNVLQMLTGVLHPVAFNTHGIENLRLYCDEIVILIDRAFKNPLDK
jgi:TetR/AcrR family transcriptional repressor of the ameABC operon